MNRRRTFVSLTLALTTGLAVVSHVSPARSQSTSSPTATETGKSTKAGSTKVTRPAPSYSSLVNAKTNPDLTVVFSSPEGGLNSANDASEIRWLFDRPVSELTENTEVNAQVSKYIAFNPPMQGSFRWASTRMLVFTPTKIANATPYTVTLQGLPALDGTTVKVPHTLSFQTPAPSCDIAATKTLPDQTDRYQVQCDQAVDEASVVANVRVLFRSIKVNPKRYAPRAADRVLMEKADPTGLAALETYFAEVVKRPRDLSTQELKRAARPKDATCTNCVFLTRDRFVNFSDAVAIVEFGAGIKSLEGPITSKRRLIGRDELGRKPLIVTSGCRVNCNPQNNFSLEAVGFQPSPATADGLIKVVDETPNVGDDPVQVYRPRTYADESRSEEPLSFRWATFTPGHRYRIEIDQRAADKGGEMLGYTSITTISFGRASAYGYVRGGEMILAPETVGVKLRSNNVKSISYIEHKLKRDELVDMVRSFNGFPKAPKLSYLDQKQRNVRLNMKNDVETVSILRAGRGKTGKETGIYLVAAKPNAYVTGSRYGVDGQPWSTADETAETSEGAGWSSMLLQRTRLGVTLKSSSFNVFVAVTDLNTGKPVSDADVALYDGASSKAFYEAKTGDDGFVTVPAGKLPKCDTCEVIAVVEKDKDMSYTQSRWREWGDDAPYYDDDISAADNATVTKVEPELVGVDKAWPIGRGQSRSIALFTDRDVYKLGEKVYLKGVLRTESAEGLAFPPSGAKLPLIVRDTTGTIVVKRTVEVSDVGSFESTFAIPGGGLQGSYSIAVANGYSSVLVAAYRKPDFVVDVKAKQKSVVRGERIAVDVDARYLFGAPMAGAETATTARWQTLYGAVLPADPALQNYSFEPNCWDADVRPCAPGLDGTELPPDNTPLDNVGHHTYSAITEAPKGPSRTYEIAVEANVTDISRQAFADRTSVTVYPGTFSFGVSSDYVIEAKKSFNVRAIAVDNSGAVVVGKKGSVEVDEWRWVVAKKKNADGSVSEYGSYELRRIATLPFTSANKPVELPVTVPRSGSYEVRIVGEDELGNQLEASTSVYAYGTDEVSWRTSEESPSVKLIADKPTYQVGDTATILVQSPWKKSEALITIEGAGVLDSQRVSMNSSAESIKVPITKQFAPNVFVSVALFSPRGVSAKEREIQAGQPSVISGSVELSVPPTDQSLKVEVGAPQKSYLPGTATKVDVKVRDSAGAAKASEVTLWAVDEGVLRLSNYTEPDLLNVFYDTRYNDVVTADGRMRLQRTADDASKGESDLPVPSPGGGGGDEPATVDGVRKDFRTLAVWAGSVKVGDSGTASVDVKLPDSLTSYRIIGVAAAGADRFGVGKSSVEVRKPFMLQPSLPRFVNVGDTFEAGVVVFNQTGTTGPVTVTVTPPTSGMALTGPTSITFPNVGEKPVEARFTFTANGVGRPRLLFAGNLGDASLSGGATANATTATSDRSDVVEAFLPIIVTQRLSVVGTSGVVTATDAGATSQSETITKPADALPGVGGLELAVASSSLAGLQNGIQDLVEYPYGCLEQRTSRIRVLQDLAELDGTYKLAGVPDDLKKVVAKELQALRPFQLENGGLSYWPDGGPVDVYLSTRTLLMLRQAKNAGIAVPTGMITAITKGLQESVSLKPTEEEVEYSSGYDLGAMRAYVAYALASEGKPEKGLVDRVYDERYEVDYLEQVYLLQAMLEAGEQGQRVESLYRDVLSSVRIDNDRAYVQWSSSYPDSTPYYLRSYLTGAEVRHSAALLTLLTKIDPKHPLIPRISRWLVQQRTNGGWSNTLETGDALHGLLSVASTTEANEPSITGAINLGTKTLLAPSLTTRTLDVTSQSFPESAVPTGSSKFGVTAKGNGTLHWSARVRYATEAAQQKALDQGITIERTYTPYQAVVRRTSAEVAAGAIARALPAPGQAAEAPASNVSSPPRKVGLRTVFNAGDLVVVTLRISTPQLRTNVVIDDPLPAGFEALDAQLANTSTVAVEDSAVETTRDRWWSGIDRTEIRDERVLLFATRLDAGGLVYTYIARATSPGVFTTPGTLAEEMYNAEVRGRTAPAVITVRAPGTR